MDLTCQYKVGKSRKIVEIGSSSKDKVTYQYELKVVTNSGEFTEDKWKSLVEKQCNELLEKNILYKYKYYNGVILIKVNILCLVIYTIVLMEGKEM